MCNLAFIQKRVWVLYLSMSTALYFTNMYWEWRQFCFCYIFCLVYTLMQGFGSVKIYIKISSYLLAIYIPNFKIQLSESLSINCSFYNLSFLYFQLDLWTNNHVSLGKLKRYFTIENRNNPLYNNIGWKSLQLISIGWNP